MENSSDRVVMRVYGYRWIILVLFASSAAINFVQFLQYSIISNITKKYYDVSDTAVQIAGLMFQIAFIILCIPTNYFIERYNLKISMIVSTGLTAVGTLLKIAAVHQDRFYLVLISQFLCAVAQIVILSIPSKVASTWFGAEQVSTASALAVFGTQIGIAIGCVWPSNAVRNSDDLQNIGDDFFIMMIINAVLATLLFILTAIFFKAKPDLPPSKSQVNLLENESPPLMNVLKTLLRNRDYWLIVLTFGLATGVWTSNGFLINDVYLYFFPDSEQDVGIISALAVLLGGCIGSVIFGYFLDKFHNFKLASFVANLLSAVADLGVAGALLCNSKLGSYFAIPLFGFFMGPTLLISFEFVTEVTYPMPESVSCSILNSVVNIFAIAFTLIMDVLIDNLGYLTTFIFQVVILLLSTVIIYFISPNLHRRQANVQDE